MVKKVGFIVNPIAGMGGAVGLKGTDGAALGDAIKLGAAPRAPKRAYDMLAHLSTSINKDDAIFLTCSDNMGEAVLKGAGISYEVIYESSDSTTSFDTIKTCERLLDAGVDAIVFCGGDGTARDILSVVGDEMPLLGVPSGVKMYSSVFALTPHAAAKVLLDYINGKASVREAAILDIDEEKYRCGKLDRKLFGYAKALYTPTLIQAPKCAYYSENEQQSKEHIAHFAAEFMADGSLYILGVGSTTKVIADVLGIEKTLLGIDLVQNGRLLKKDASEKDILAYLVQGVSAKIIVSPLGAQGFIFGRGNHQISAEVLRMIGKDNVIVVGTPYKLQQTPQLFVDTGDPAIDQAFCGYVSVVCGYRLAARKHVMGC